MWYRRIVCIILYTQSDRFETDYFRGSDILSIRRQRAPRFNNNNIIIYGVIVLTVNSAHYLINIYENIFIFLCT